MHFLTPHLDSYVEVAPVPLVHGAGTALADGLNQLELFSLSALHKSHHLLNLRHRVPLLCMGRAMDVQSENIAKR